MSEALPHRAKPQLLHHIARYIREKGEQVHKTNVYSDIQENRKTLRRTMLYGVELGFLQQEGDAFRLTNYGWSLSAHVEYDGNEAVEEEFRDAIERFDPYRQILQIANERDADEVVLGSNVLTQSALKTIASELVEGDVQNREINVLIKTAEAAGLGEYRAGKKGYESRLIIGQKFEEFIHDMAEQYELPDDFAREEVPASSKPEKMPAKSRGSTKAENNTSGAGQLKLTVEFDVDDKSNEEIAELVETVRNAV